MKSVIEAFRDPQVYVNKDFRDIIKEVPNPIYYRHEDGREFSAIVGGIAWPVLNGEDGCTLIVATSRDTDPVFTVLDHFRSSSPTQLIKACYTLRTRYGHGEYSEAFNFFIGPQRFENIVRIENEGIDRPLIIVEPCDYDQPNSDDLFLDEIRSLSGDMKLIINDPALRDALKAMSLSDADKKLLNFPATLALGMMLHDMQVRRPWLDHGDNAFNMDDPDIGRDAINLE